MLFNSYIFVLVFLPLVLTGFYLLAGRAARWRIDWLILASLIFYGWWSPPYVLLLIFSTVVNFIVGKLIARGPSRFWLIAGLIFNLGLIAYFKYFYFLLSQFLAPADIAQHIPWASPLLPLGISFYTFQKIAYLVDTYQRKVVPHSFHEFTLFVSFFPQLVAGPIVHQKEILPQLQRFQKPANMRWIAMGVVCFIFGLAKKTVLADPLGNIAAPIFLQSLHMRPDFAQAWLGALAYTLQLYFDFSAYSDMAIGLGLMFGIRLPLNFFSPYKATSMIDFWRRWHITLSRFLRDYLYIPLGGNRKGPARRYINIMLTMLIGGLWHGAGWTFVLWGGLHGLYLCINHAWEKAGLKLPRMLAWLLTFLAVVFAWVLFRAENMTAALAIWRAMLSPAAVSVDAGGAAMVALGLLIALGLPNIQQWLKGQWRLKYLPLVGRWQPTPVHGLALGGVLWLCLLMVQFVQAEFLYFNF